MNAEIAKVVGQVIAESREEYFALHDEPAHGASPETLTRYSEWVRMRMLDRWYWFAPFGVESRAQLAPVKVMAANRERSRPIAVGDAIAVGQTTLDTQVIVAGTPLESR